MLVEQHATEMYRVAAAIVGEADARDVTQESFVAAWTHAAPPPARRLATTTAQGAADYELNKAVLDRIMALIEFEER